jgi:hypothetical protein
MTEQHHEPRHAEDDTGGPMSPATRERLDNATLDHLQDAGIAFVDFLDAWVDKGIADGTLTIDKAARYREAIAARCAELGEVPSVREHLMRLDLKPGDVLGVTAPVDSRVMMDQMATHLRRFLDYAGVRGVEVAVFPPGTEFRVLTPGADPAQDTVRQWAAQRLRDGVMSPEEMQRHLQSEVRLDAAYRHLPQGPGPTP